MLTFCTMTLFITPITSYSLEISGETHESPSKDKMPFASEYYKELNSVRDAELQRNLETIVNKNRLWKSLVQQQLLSIGLVDLHDATHPRYADINGRNMMYAASLPKIAVLLSAMEAIEDGSLKRTSALEKDMRLMIAKSNNAATTRVIERIGFKKISEVMTSEKYKLYDENNGGGLWVGKKYAKAGKRNPDPLKGLSHAATVEQVCRFYTMLAYGKLVSDEGNREMMTYLVDPELNHKFVNTLRKIDPNYTIFRKSGTWRNYHSDSVLVEGENGKRYILVALIQDDSGSTICKKLVNDVEKILATVKA